MYTHTCIYIYIHTYMYIYIYIYIYMYRSVLTTELRAQTFISDDLKVPEWLLALT